MKRKFENSKLVQALKSEFFDIIFYAVEDGVKKKEINLQEIFLQVENLITRNLSNFRFEFLVRKDLEERELTRF